MARHTVLVCVPHLELRTALLEPHGRELRLQLGAIDATFLCNLHQPSHDLARRLVPAILVAENSRRVSREAHTLPPHGLPKLGTRSIDGVHKGPQCFLIDRCHTNDR